MTINSVCNIYFDLQTSELLSGKAFNSMSNILHFDLLNVSYIPQSALQIYYKDTINQEGVLQPLLLLITINSVCNMYFDLQTL